MSGAEHRECEHPVLRLTGVSVTYPPASTVLDDVSFEVFPGELIAVVGPNGAGKSTLFKAISGLVGHEGTVELGGVHCHHQRDRLGAAYIPQRSDLDHDFPITVGQLVLAGRRRFLRLGQRPGAAITTPQAKHSNASVSPTSPAGRWPRSRAVRPSEHSSHARSPRKPTSSCSTKPSAGSTNPAPKDCSTSSPNSPAREPHC